VGSCVVRVLRRRLAVPVFSDQFSRPSSVRARSRRINALTRRRSRRISNAADAPLHLPHQTGSPPCWFLTPSRVALGYSADNGVSWPEWVGRTENSVIRVGCRRYRFTRRFFLHSLSTMLIFFWLFICLACMIIDPHVPSVVGTRLVVSI